MATMKQVAERAGVSTSTVSHVINNTRKVSASARARVLAVIAETRYIPSAVARSLKHARTHTIGMLVPNNSDPYFAELIEGIERIASRAAYSLILCNTGAEAAKQAACLRGLLEKRIDGLIVVAGEGDGALADLLRTAGVPMVLVEREVAGVEADFLGADHQEGGYRATGHLLALGHRRIGCVAGPLPLPSSVARVAGYRRALHDAGIAFDAALLAHGDYTSIGGHGAFTSLLALAAPPSAIFAANDLMAIGGLCAAAEAGVQVPAQLSVIGYDDIAQASYASPRLSTIAQPTHAMGELVTELLLERIGGMALPPRHVSVPTRLVARQSTAPWRPVAARRVS